MSEVAVERELRKLNRRFDSVEKNLELILKDRDMLETIELKIDNLNNTILTYIDRLKEVQKNHKADIRDVQSAVEDKVEEVKEMVDSKKIVPVKNKRSWIGRLFKRK